ncbi:MAG: hypothetical protein RR518_07620 [Coprobacillus sp.]
MSGIGIKEDLSRKKYVDSYDGFIELMSDERIQLPLREDEEYKLTLENLFEYYCMKVSKVLSEKQVNSMRMICDIILQIIDEDNDSAFQRFERLMNIDIFTSNLHIIEDELPIDGYGRTNINLFRLRRVIENKNYKRIDIFHEPKTDKLYENSRPYRYNLEYRPSLYLASTVYCCKEELGVEGNKDMVIGSMMRLDSKADKKLYIVDLGNRPIDYVKANNKYKKANIGYSQHNYMFIYPFIAACSVVVPNKKKRNIIEYKLTQILYRWLVKYHEDKLCGIRYFSCYDGCYKMVDKKNKYIFERDSKTSFTKYFINYAFPISKSVDDSGYCNRLKETFIISNPKFIKDYATIKRYEEELKYNTTLTRVDK